MLALLYEYTFLMYKQKQKYFYCYELLASL